MLLGKTPWYPGYNEYKNRFIQDAVKDQVIHDAFLSGERLPENYGIGLDERVVEYPWLFSRLPSTAERILDAGAVLNQGWILDLPQIIQKDVVIYTLAPECFSRISDRVSYVYGDLRRSILRDDAVSAVVCLSTLEHIGMDNTSHY